MIDLTEVSRITSLLPNLIRRGLMKELAGQVDIQRPPLSQGRKPGDILARLICGAFIAVVTIFHIICISLAICFLVSGLYDAALWASLASASLLCLSVFMKYMLDLDSYPVWFCLGICFLVGALIVSIFTLIQAGPRKHQSNSLPRLELQKPLSTMQSMRESVGLKDHHLTARTGSTIYT